jgi:hypothetical protein
MAAILYKWFLLLCLTGLVGMAPAPAPVNHPFFISVTEIEHNAKEKTLEISCKIFTDDFEKTLRQNYASTPVDLINIKNKAAMDRIVSEYVLRHFSVKVDGKIAALKFIGFQRQEEAVYSFFEVADIPSVKKIAVTDNLLYDYKKEQVSMVHVTVGGNLKSTKMNNPDDKYVFEF